MTDFIFLTKDMSETRYSPSIYLLDEDIVSVPYFLEMPRYLPYSMVIKEKLKGLVSNGMIEKWHAEENKLQRDEKVFVEEVEAEVLTVDILWLGFLFYLICIAVA